MGAVIEIKIMSQCYIKSEEIICILIQEKISVMVHNMELMNNWNYEDVVAIDYKDCDIKKQVEAGKIYSVEVVLENTYRAGMQQYRENDMFSTDLWLDTSKLEFLDSDKINKVNGNFYKKVTQVALKNQYSWQWKCIAIGVETCIESKTSLQEMIYNSKNVNVWIVINGIVDSLEGYSVIKNGNIKIYLKL